MGKGLIVSALILAAAGAVPESASADQIEGTDLFCEHSLPIAEAALTASYEELEGALNRVDRARLRRAHTDWMRFRDADCAFAVAGLPGRKCCLQRHTEARTDELRLYQTAVRPTELNRWADPISRPEKTQLLAHVAGRGPRFAPPVHPQQVLRVGDAQYLLTFATTQAGAKGLEYVNLRRGTTHRLLRGGPRFLGVLLDRKETRHVLVLSETVDRRILWRDLQTLTLVRSDDDLVVQPRRLALFQEDAGAGRCDRHSAEFLGMDRAQVLGEIRLADLNDDGTPDVSLEVTEVECRTGAATPRIVTFLAGDAGFEEAIWSDP